MIEIKTRDASGRICREIGSSDQDVISHLKTIPLPPSDHLHGIDLYHWLDTRAKYLGSRPTIISVSDGSEVSGVVFLLERKIAGIRVGVYESPYLCGFCSYLGSDPDKSQNIFAAMSFLLRRRLTFRITLTVRAAPEHIAILAALVPTLPNGFTHISEKGSYLPLSAEVVSVINRFSQKFRRNLRYFRRIAVERYQYRFLSSLNTTEALKAVNDLNAASARSMIYSKASYRCRATRSVPGGFSAGLIAKDGSWLSYITGWRADCVTYVDWQLNREESNRVSFANIMRFDLINHEISLGSSAIYFLGGLTSTWENASAKHKIISLNARKSGFSINFISMAAALIASLRPIRKMRQIANKFYYTVNF